MTRMLLCGLGVLAAASVRRAGSDLRRRVLAKLLEALKPPNLYPDARHFGLQIIGNTSIRRLRMRKLVGQVRP